MFSNLFEALSVVGHDEDWEGVASPEFCPTHAPPGSEEKIEVLRERVRRGLPLWHPEDETQCRKAGGVRMDSQCRIRVIRAKYARKGVHDD
jgi:hypothetical protein